MKKTLSNDALREIKYFANDIRRSIIESLSQAGSGHTAGPLGMADIFAVFYTSVYNHNPRDPFWSERDMLVLSNGHICPVLYATMAHSGYFPLEELQTLRTFKSRLQGHPHRECLPGLETSSGPLGSGLSQTVGMVLAENIYAHESERFFYCFMSDGEHQCGQLWEAVLQAGNRELSHIVGVIDRNHIQINGRTEQVMGLEPLREKYESFKWHVQSIDGHDVGEVYNAFKNAKEETTKPSIIIAETIPGKGVPEFEDDYRWHGAPPGKGPENIVPRKEQTACALASIEKERKKI